MSLLWAATVFLGSGLLFVIQPMIARMLLPRVGGAPSTWTTCVLFFQGVLLAGYVYAHWVGRRPARTQIAIHGMLLLLPLAVLPFSIVSGASGTGALAPTFWLLRALALAIGLPFFALSAGTPLLQRWLAGTRLPGSDNPYVLYAASNAASLLALAAYPVLIEPALGLARQALFWAVGYAVYVALALMCAVRAWRTSASFKDDGEPAVDEADEPPPARRLHWIALAAAPSSLMLGVTSLLTADAAGLPFLWILPLALYLLTFVLAFARRPGPSRLSDRLPIAAVVFLLLWLIKATEPLAIILGAHLAAFFVAAMVCHSELARLRPPPRHLTAYYAYVGLGGVIGGAFNTLIAPVIFHDWVEIPLAFTLVCLLKPPRDESDARFRWSDLALAAGLGLLTVALVKAGDVLGATGQTRAALTVGIPVLLMFLLSRRRYRFGLAVGAVLWAGSLDTSLRGKPEMTARSFFGVHRVTRADVTESGATTAFRKLYHGSTIHGVQRVDATGAPVLPREPLGYYSRNSPIGRLFRSYPADAGPKRVGIVGLGAGSLLAYAEAGDRWTLFEIDPLVQQIAEDDRLFSYLPEARKRGVAADVVLGDARVTLAGDDGPFDVLVLDAFTSAAVPVHLLTREALALYDRKLAPSGIVACHISNRHLDLGSLVRATAEDLGLASTLDAGPPSSGAPAMVMPSRWAFLARSSDALRARDLPSIVTFVLRKRGRTWTDDRSDLWSVFQW